MHRKSCVLSGRFHLCEESIHNLRFGLMAFPSRFLDGGTSLHARQKDALFDGSIGLGNRAIDKERLSQRGAGSKNPARAHARPMPNGRQGGTPRRQDYWVTLEGMALRCQSAGTADLPADRGQLAAPPACPYSTNPFSRAKLTSRNPAFSAMEIASDVGAEMVTSIGTPTRADLRTSS